MGERKCCPMPFGSSAKANDLLIIPPNQNEQMTYHMKKWYGYQSGERRITLMLYLFMLYVSFMNIAVVQGSSCSCTNLKYTWRLNFDGSCPSNLSGVGNVEDFVCKIEGSGRVEVLTAYKILEFGPNLSSVAHVERVESKSLKDGDMVHYSSITNSDPGVSSTGLLLSAQGFDSGNHTVTLNWTIKLKWTKQCGVDTALEGVGIGWFVFNTTDAAMENSCYSCSSKKESKRCKSKRSKVKKKSSKSPKKSGTRKTKKESSEYRRRAT